MMQAFENLSFYEKRKRIDMQYIYEQYAYYIKAVWNNVEIKKYVKMTRCQPGLIYAYRNFEELKDSMAIRLTKDSADGAKVRCK